MGLLDDIAAVATGKKTKEETHTYKVAKNNPESQEGRWMQDDNVQKAWSNAKNMAADPDFKTEGQKKSEKDPDWFKKDETPKVIKEELPTVIKKEKKVSVDDKKKKYRWLNPQTGKVELRDIPFLMQMTGATSYRITPTGDIVLVDQTGSTIKTFQAIDKLGGALDKITGFDPTKTFGDMGDTGKAALYNKISKMKPDEFRAFLNRKGNLDRIQQYYGEMDFEAQGNFEDILKTGDAQGFAKLIRDSAGDSEGFNKALLKEQKPQQYWDENHPRTQGDVEEAARSGISWIEGYGPIERPEGQGLASLGGGGGGGTQPVDPTDPDANLMPSGTYLASQYNKTLVPDPNLDPYKNAMYTTGIEQQHLAGGYWDPDSGQWVGSPWGTENLWQGANPPINVAEGGPIRAPSSKVTQGGGGLFDFKPYGF